MRTVPQTLPQGLYDAAARRTPTQGARGPPSRQMSGQVPGRVASPLASSFGSPTMSAQSTGNDWLVSPQEKSGYDRAFTSIDVQGRGFITGDQAVPFFSNSGLDEETLAQIWDLADINSEGQLSREEFAVAMYLIRQQRGKVGGRGVLPAALPPALIPPTMRQRVAPPTVSTAPNFENAAPAAPQQKSAADDLFGLDAMSDPVPAPAPAPAPALQPMPKSDPFTVDTPGSPSSPKGPAPGRSTGTPFRAPFVPSSKFGLGLTAQGTGESAQSDRSVSRPVVPAAGADDLLGDTDPEISNKFNSETTELANMSNQIGTLHTQMKEVQGKRTGTERDLANTSNQKKELENRLAQFRSQYEEEVRAVKSLEARLTTCRAETTKLTQDIAMLDGTHQDLKAQHQQLMASFESDQHENANLKDRIRVVNAEVAELKPVLEKLRTDAKQQKGITAINKKQLATSELEREKLQSEKGELEKAAHERSLETETTQEPPSRELAASPAASTLSPSTNPFFRKSPQPSFDQFTSPAATTRSEQAPDAGQSAHRSAFDSYFTSENDGAHAEVPVESSATSPPPAPHASGFQTPTRLERDLPVGTPSAAEPPPPPQSRQITSAALPLQVSQLSDQSPTSSVRANPPASRAGFSDTGASGFGGSASETTPSTPREAASAIPGAFPGESDAGEVGPSTSEEASSSKSDFDSAFDATGIQPATEKSVNGYGVSRHADPEFPPIQDVEPDESDSDDTETGFDDAFAQQKTSQAEASKAPAGQSQGLPPGADSQPSPPPYGASTAADGQNNDHFPKKYTGLLPHRESSSGSPPTLETAASSSIPTRAAESVASPDSTTLPVSSELRGAVPANASSKAAKDEFEDAFDDLDEAKEADEQGQEGFGFSGASGARDADDDFNPSFDSPVPSKSTTMNDSVQHTPTASTSRAFEQYNSSTAGSSTTSPFAVAAAPVQPGAPAAAGSSHDWDAIFAGLDSDTAAGSSSAQSPFSLNQPGSSNHLAAPAAPASRPAGPGRAISQGTDHDDPILKSLTGMGYAREKALAALEKYDYNLDKVRVNQLILTELC